MQQTTIGAYFRCSPHALKYLDAVATIMQCHRGQEIPNNSGPSGHWYYVIAGAVRRCTIRSGKSWI